MQNLMITVVQQQPLVLQLRLTKKNHYALQFFNHFNAMN